MSKRVLIAGFSTRHVAQSACQAGYKVCAVDHFCDQDLNWYTEDRIPFEELDDLPGAVSEMSSRHRFDMFVATSGAEDLPSKIPVCGTSPEKIRRFLDKLTIQHFFEDLGIPVPPLSKEGEYPSFFKPCRGSGGWRNAIIHNEDERIAWEGLSGGIPYISQRVVDGIPASVCCIANGTDARAIAANEQILRGSGNPEFGFAGSVTPCSHPITRSMITLAERIAAASGCSGTIGIDFIFGEKEIYAIELNPRFQATVDTVERASGCNLFNLHVKACTGVLPANIPAARRYVARRILFADRDMTVSRDLKPLFPMIADIPWPGTALERDQAITSVFGEGSTRRAALAALDTNITTVRQYLR